MKLLFRVGPLVLTDNVLHVGNRHWRVEDIQSAFIRTQSGIVYRLGMVFWGLCLLLGYFVFLNPATKMALLSIDLPMGGQELFFGICVVCGLLVCVLNLAFPRKFLIVTTSTGEWPVLFSRHCVRLLDAWNAVQQAIHLKENQKEKRQELMPLPKPKPVQPIPHSAQTVPEDMTDLEYAKTQPRERFLRPARKISAPGSEARRSSVRATPESSAKTRARDQRLLRYRR